MDNVEGTMFKAMGDATVKLADPVKPLPSARIVVAPTCPAVTSPPLLTLAMPGCVELHATNPVRLCVVPSLKVAIACSWRLLPTDMNTVAGVMFKPTTAARVTVRFAVPVTDPAVALMLVVPIDQLDAKPPAAIIATYGSDELHVTVEVRCFVLPSVYFPVAENCNDSPSGTVPFAGVTAMDTSAGGPTVAVVEPHTEPAHALTVAVPPAPRA